LDFGANRKDFTVEDAPDTLWMRTAKNEALLPSLKVRLLVPARGDGILVK
jgi:hypothetical protein